jgi:hypothetical protein
MESYDELSRFELVALKEVRAAGKIADRSMAKKLVDDDMIVAVCGDRLQLTAKGRRMLVRGSPALWELAS